MFVKICGTTSEEDALLAVALGADAIGFVFAPSPRQVTPGAVGDIVKRLPAEVLTVGVFRDHSPQRVVEIMASSGLRAAQLHGRETPADTAFVRRHVPMVIKAFSAATGDIARAREYQADAVLLDGATPGSGQVFDWSLAGEAPAGVRVILAGGLTATNVGDAIAHVRPWGVDAASGVEVDGEPGRKDPRKLRDFIAAAKAAATAAYEGRGTGPYDWRDRG